jgi:hypothetical protein
MSPGEAVASAGLWTKRRSCCFAETCGQAAPERPSLAKEYHMSHGKPAFAAGALFGAFLLSAAMPATAQDVRIGCSLVQQYGGAEVSAVLEQVRSTVGEGEANALHAKYVGLKNDCSSNLSASRVVRLSPAMHRLLTEYGVNVHRFAVLQR